MDTNVVTNLGFLAVTLYLVWKEYRSGNNAINTQVVANYNALDKQQKEKITEQETAIAQYQKDMAEIKSAMNKMKEDFARETGRLQGQITAKDLHITQLQQTILNRNPELEKLLSEIRDFMENIYSQNKHQTTMLEAGQLRNKNIDDATIHDKGKPIRIPVNGESEDENKEKI